MDLVRFEGRDLEPYGEYVSASELVEGRVYFAVHFLDDDMLVPELRPLVFIGWNLEADDASRLYLQDADSYLNGVRHGDGKEADIHCVEDKTPFVFEFDRALDVLLRCSIKRQTQEK